MNETETIQKPEGFKAPAPLFNRRAIKRHALKVSKQVRAGKFTRVSEDFLNNVCAAAESRWRALLAEVPNESFGQVEPTEQFLTSAGKKKLAENFNVFIAREVHRQSKNVRVGKTL